jgi:NTE family protein
MKIGLALSGGGFRATVFHLGVLARLADENRLEQVEFLSTVSGGSLCAGLVHALNGFRWPASRDFIARILPRARELLITQDLQIALIWSTVKSILRSPLTLFESRAAALSELLRTHWGVAASLSDLPERPRWMINATCYETARNWRFERFQMGDYRFGYSRDTQGVRLSEALAASAGFPGLIGALALDTHGRAWFRYTDASAGVSELTSPHVHLKRATEPIPPAYPRVHLWDGGVYDNLGLEGLHNFREGWRANMDFLIVSDASGRSGPAKYQIGPSALLRIISGIMMDQIRSLRSRAVLERMVTHGDPGGFLQIGNTCQYVLDHSPRRDDAARLCPGCLSPEEADAAANMPTVIRRLSPEEFRRLFRHGFEVADYTLYAHHAEQFRYIGYGNSPWASQM